MSELGNTLCGCWSILIKIPAYIPKSVRRALNLPLNESERTIQRMWSTDAAPYFLRAELCVLPRAERESLVICALRKSSLVCSAKFCSGRRERLQPPASLKLYYFLLLGSKWSRARSTWRLTTGVRHQRGFV